MSIKKVFLIGFLFAAIVSASSCTRKFFPTYNQTAVDLVDRLGNDLNNLFDGMTKVTDKSYTAHEAEYSEINAELATLQSLNSTRPNAGIPTGMVNDLIKRFSGYEEEHKTDVTQNNERFLINKNGMHALWSPLHNSEINLKPYKP